MRNRAGEATATSAGNIRRNALAIAATLSIAAAAATLDLEAADQWIEVRSANFVIASNASLGSTRTLAWQLEQIRSAITTLFGWARVDLDRPLSVIAAKDESSMRALAPGYWELKGGIRPASVWVTGADQHYLAIRADVRAEDRDTINPHITAYHAYASLVLQQSVVRDLPFWFMRGFAGVLSNTIVRENQILLGPPVPWHLERLRQGSRLRLPELMAVTRFSREYTSADRRDRFDAQCWAFVHFLIFADGGARREGLNRFVKLVSTGTNVDAAMRESLGATEALEADFLIYINRNLFSFLRYTVDASVKREGFETRPLAPHESASVRALFHAAMGRVTDARSAIADARKDKADAAESFVAEALMLERGGNKDQAAAATPITGSRPCGGARNQIGKGWPESRICFSGRSSSITAQRPRMRTSAR
jgi:hypothetical protein